MQAYSIFLAWGRTFMYLQYHLLPNIWKASYTIRASIFVDVPYWPPYSTDKFISCVIPNPSQWSFYFGEEIAIAWIQEKLRQLTVQDPIILHDNASSETAAAVTNLLRRWQWEILKHPPYSPDESMRLRSLRQSERTAAWDPVRHKRWTYMCCRADNTEHQQRWTRWWCTTSSKHLVKGDK